MDAAIRATVENARAALAEVGAAQQQALLLLHEIEWSLERGDTAKAVADETILLEEMGLIGKALLDFAREALLKAHPGAGSVS